MYSNANLRADPTVSISTDVYEPAQSKFLQLQLYDTSIKGF